MRIGIYQRYWGELGGGQRYTGLAAQFLAGAGQVTILHHRAGFDRVRVEEGLELDLSRVAFRHVPEPVRPVWPSANPVRRLALEENWCREFSAEYDLFLNNSDQVPVFSHARHGVLLTHFPVVTYDEFNGRNNGQWQQRSTLSRLGRKLFQSIEWKRRLGSYRTVIVNSEFGRRWIARRWGVQAEVLYPPLRRGMDPGTKEELILAVGAFHDAQHKRQDVLVDAFKQLVDDGLCGWRLVLAGGCNGTDGAKAFVERLRQSGAGYPVDVLVNVGGDELVNSFGRASVLWHAMGYGVDEEKHPERCEHFGMVATEAMAAGCIPIVFDGGGLREIVESGRNGFRWRTIAELKSATLQVIRDEALRQSMRKAAVERSKEFSEEAFRRRLFQILDPFLSQPRAV